MKCSYGIAFLCKSLFVWLNIGICAKFVASVSAYEDSWPSSLSNFACAKQQQIIGTHSECTIRLFCCPFIDIPEGHQKYWEEPSIWNIIQRFRRMELHEHHCEHFWNPGNWKETLSSDQSLAVPGRPYQSLAYISSLYQALAARSHIELALSVPAVLSVPSWPKQSPAGHNTP